MKRLLLALAAFMSTPAFGQAYDHSDWLDGSVPTRDWSVDSTNPTGSAPADAFEPADESSPIADGSWVITTSDLADYVQIPSRERKFRTLCEPANAKIVDPVLFHGTPSPVGHRHEGIGNVGWDENTTFTTLRASPSSTCAGGPMNGTIYWEPEVIKELPNGVGIGVRPQNATFYYINGQQNEPQIFTWLRRNFRFIGGVNPNDFNDTARRAEYTAGGLEYPGNPVASAGFAGWQCFRGSDLTLVAVTVTESQMQTAQGAPNGGAARHLKSSNGSDPWGGNCTGTVAHPGLLMLNLSGPSCWDGHNLGAPDGRGHVAYAARSSDNVRQNVCPRVTVNGVVQQYRHIPALEAKTEFYHTGFTDYGTWYFGSDRMNTPSTPADPTSIDPCRQTGPYFCNGATAHFDWWYGWKSSIIDEWQRECLGITVRGVAPTNGPAECNTSQISKFRKLQYGGTSPDSSLSGGCVVILACSAAVPGLKSRYNPIPDGTAVPGAVGHHLR